MHDAKREKIRSDCCFLMSVAVDYLSLYRDEPYTDATAVVPGLGHNLRESPSDARAWAEGCLLYRSERAGDGDTREVSAA